ncbi:hypothetical protein LPJ56_003518, partial [Coemansia sp. RSA 2599]
MESDRKPAKKVTRDSQCLVDIPDVAENMDADPAVILGASSTNSDNRTRKTFRVEPPSDLLSRLNAFLPQIAEANKQLEVAVAQDPHKHDIENIDQNEDQYIEMDLGLGVFDMKPKKDIGSIDGILIHDIPATAESDGDEEESDIGSDEDQGTVAGGSRVIISPSSILKRKNGTRPPGIKVIGGSDAHGSTADSSSDDSSDSNSEDSESDSSTDSESDSSSQSSSDNDITMAE